MAEDRATRKNSRDRVNGFIECDIARPDPMQRCETIHPDLFITC
jgi:hypothetical protein